MPDLLRRLRGVSARPPAAEQDALDAPLLYLSEADAWTVRDACEGTQIFGGTGSGKTSGSGAAIAKAFLRAGFGGLVLTAKTDERATWERYAKETGRGSSFVVVSPGEKWRFNFLDYEVRRPGAGAGLTENVVNLFTSVMEVGERRQGQGSNDGYWNRSLKQLLRNAVDALVIAYGRLSLPEIYDLVASAPHSPDEVQSEAWQGSSFCYRTLIAAETHAPELGGSKERDFDITAKYWLGEFPALAEKTRSIIVSSFTGMADGFLRGSLREIFCTSTNLLPEFTHEGAVIIVDLPVKEYAEVGQFAQVLMKLMWQRATERRDVLEHPRPVFLWADESQYFITSGDALFQTTARSARACTVYLTQNLPNYRAVLGHDHAAADSLLGNLQTKIFHANGDHTTNTWAADIIARTWQTRSNASATQNHNSLDASGRGSVTGGASQAVEYQVLPSEFTILRKGGPQAGFAVDGVVFQPGRVWQASRSNHLRVSFSQKGD